MEFRQLKYFVEVGRLQSFSQASKSLFITQSTLSQQIRRLEEELGVDLLVRDTRHVRLSDYGEQFFPYAEQILQDAAASMDRLKEVRGLTAGSLSIGMTYSFAPLLMQTVRDFYREYPHIHLHIHSLSKELLMQSLLDHELDIALSYKSQITDERISSHLLFSNDLSLVMRREAAAGLRPGRMSVAKLSKFPLALPSRGLQARDTLESILFGKNMSLDIRLEINSLHALLDLVENSDLATVVSSATVRHLPGLVAFPIDHPDGRMEGCYHCLKGTYQKKASEVFLRMLVENNTFNLAMDA